MIRIHVIGFFSIFLCVLLLSLGSWAVQGGDTVEDWTRKGDLGETPKRITDEFPLSDQENKGDWVRYEVVSDEFNGAELDADKWIPKLYWWKGRAPAFFNPANVTVSDGKMHLAMRKEEIPEMEKYEQYHTYTSAAVHSKARVGYGYYEVMAKPMESAGSSSFWFQQTDDPDWGIEIDVFEIGGRAPGFERKYNMNLHISKTPEEKRHWSRGGVWVAPWDLVDDYHIYGLEWNEKKIKYYVDGVIVRSTDNTHWHKPIYMIFDSETMPEWFGMPDDKDLPSTYSVEYVRAWRKQGEKREKD